MAGRQGWGIEHSVTAAYAQLTSEVIVLDATLWTSTVAGVTGLITFKIGAQEFGVGSNRSFQLYGIDVSSIQVKGDTNYRVTVFGTVRHTGG